MNQPDSVIDEEVYETAALVGKQDFFSLRSDQFNNHPVLVLIIDVSESKIFESKTTTSENFVWIMIKLLIPWGLEVFG